MTMSMAAAYREHYPGARQWKAQSVAESASKLAAKIAPRIEWLKEQAAHEEIVSLIEVKKLLSGIIRDGSEPTMARLGAVDRMAKLERWDAAGPDRQQTQVFFNCTNEKGESLI
ncbi:hypothetical protein KQH29_00835 [bacterium]|nr:hypothetical protein [bacterium]